MYKNIFHIIGRKWITREQIELVLKEFPEDSYSVYVVFADKSSKALHYCTGSETNIDSIYIGYRDGSLSIDREPYRFIVTRPFDAGFFLKPGQFVEQRVPFVVGHDLVAAAVVRL